MRQMDKNAHFTTFDNLKILNCFEIKMLMPLWIPFYCIFINKLFQNFWERCSKNFAAPSASRMMEKWPILSRKPPLPLGVVTDPQIFLPRKIFRSLGKSLSLFSEWSRGLIIGDFFVETFSESFWKLIYKMYCNASLLKISLK